MLSEFHDDLLEIDRRNVARFLCIEMTERLSKSLSLQSLHQLREFAVVPPSVREASRCEFIAHL